MDDDKVYKSDNRQWLLAMSITLDSYVRCGLRLTLDEMQSISDKLKEIAAATPPSPHTVVRFRRR